jgi:hypothetical protein
MRSVPLPAKWPMLRNTLSRFIFLAAALAAPGIDAACAAELHRGRCHMDECGWYSVEQKDAVASNADSTLFKVTFKTWTSTHRGAAYDKKAPRVGGDPFSNYYMCSKTKPAVVESVDGKWTATFLNLFVPPGYQETAVAQYFVVCHGFDVEASRSRFDVAARRFGYRRISDTPGDIVLSKPEEVLTR